MINKDEKVEDLKFNVQKIFSWKEDVLLEGRSFPGKEIFPSKKVM
jgi:hypothetical protein